MFKEKQQLLNQNAIQEYIITSIKINDCAESSPNQYYTTVTFDKDGYKEVREMPISGAEIGSYYHLLSNKSKETYKSSLDLDLKTYPQQSQKNTIKLEIIDDQSNCCSKHCTIL